MERVSKYARQDLYEALTVFWTSDYMAEITSNKKKLSCMILSANYHRYNDVFFPPTVCIQTIGSISTPSTHPISLTVVH